MFELVFSPGWFFGVDIAFEAISVVVTLLISLYVYKIYKVSEERRHKYFSLAFLLIALSFVLKILTNFEIYYDVMQILQSKDIIIASGSIVNRSHTVRIFRMLGLFLFRFLLGIAVMGIYLVMSDKNRKRSDIFIMTYLVALVAVLTSFIYFALNITLVILLAFICYELYSKYDKIKNPHTAIVLYSFILLLASQIFFSFALLKKTTYVAGEGLQLFGYIGLLINYVAVRAKRG